MASVYIYVIIDNGGNLRGDQFVHTIWLEMTLSLLAHSSSLINMMSINGNELQKRAWHCVKERCPD